MLFGKKNQQRDRFERMCEEIFPALYGTALRLTRDRDEASDLTQEATVRAYEAFDRFDGRNFKAWMLRILTNVYINKYRQRKRGSPVDSLEEENIAEPMAPEGTIPDRALFDNLVGAEVEEALSKVPADVRVTVLLSDVEGMTYEEIAEATNVPVGTVRSRLARGRAILRRELEQFALARGYVKKEDLE